MKFALSFLTSFLLLVLYSFSQEGTSLEEYRYGSKGYGYQKEMGLDTEKDGYVIKELLQAKENVQVVGLFNTAQTAKALIFIFSDDRGMEASYLCLPNEYTSPEVMQLYQTDKKEVLQGEKEALFEKTLQSLTFTLLNQSSNQNISLSNNPDDPAIKNIPESYNNSELDAYFDPAPASTSKETIYKEAASPPPILQTKGVDKTIEGDLEFRKTTINPPLTTKTTKKGKVMVKICVNTAGKVTAARYTQRGSTLIDAKLIELAEENAKSTQFVTSEKKEECGTVEYRF